jgi:hypothetical protein
LLKGADEALYKAKKVLCRQEKVDMRETVLGKGCLVGLNRGRETLAVGAVADVSRESLSVLSPPVSAEDVDRVIANSLTVRFLS